MLCCFCSHHPPSTRHNQTESNCEVHQSHQSAMVRMNAFEVQIVEAESKQPFKEHTKDGKVYVEVEPDVEYFIAIHKVEASQNQEVLLRYKVDDTRFNFHHSYRANEVMREPKYVGLRQRHDGYSYHKALKFEKPVLRSSEDVKTPISNLLMGKIQIEMFEGAGTRLKKQSSSSYTTITKAKVESRFSSLADKKSLRSTAGTTTGKVKRCSDRRSHSKQGRLLDTLTLTYCSALGLIEVGVLPKPGLWEHHRMKFPLNDAKTEPNDIIEILD